LRVSVFEEFFFDVFTDEVTFFDVAEKAGEKSRNKIVKMLTIK
jgi:hypothetical protein